MDGGDDAKTTKGKEKKGKKEDEVEEDDKDYVNYESKCVFLSTHTYTHAPPPHTHTHDTLSHTSRQHIAQCFSLGRRCVCFFFSV